MRATASINLGSLEKSIPLSSTSVARRETRSCSLAGGVELRKLGDCRDLAQQAPGVDPPLLQRARGPGQLRRPAELGLDLPDELADLVRRRLGLLVLDADERSLCS